MSPVPATFRIPALIAAAFALSGARVSGEPWAQPKPDDSKTEKKAARDSASKPAPKATPASTKSGTTQVKAGEAAAESKKVSPDPDPKPRRVPSYAEILRELQKETRGPGRVVIPPSRAGEARARRTPADVGPANAIRPVERRLLPDGSRIVDRPGRLTQEGNLFTFSFESRGQGPPEMPIRLLPNRLLEDMEIFSDGGRKPVVFVISGEVTEYRGVNYLLIQKLLVRPDLGNLK